MTTTSSFCGQGDFPAWCMCRRRLQSREGPRWKETPAQKVSCQPPRNLCVGIHLGWEAPAHQEEPWVRWRMCVAVFSYSFLKSVLSNGNSLKKICHRILRPIKKCLIKKHKNKFQTFEFSCVLSHMYFVFNKRCFDSTNLVSLLNSFLKGDKGWDTVWLLRPRAWEYPLLELQGVAHGT